MSPSALTVTPLPSLAHSPLEHGAHVVLPALEVEAEDLAHLAADHLLVREAGELARAAAAAMMRPSWSQTKNAALGAG